MKRKMLLFLLVMLSLANILFAGTTGKITGTILDAADNSPLPGVNVVIDGTSMGVVTNLDGYYVILNVPPGIYTLKLSLIGYSAQSVQNVRVLIDLTTEINVQLKSEVLAGELIVITAEKPIVQKDVAASLKNLTANDIAALPATNIGDVMGLQAGITSSLQIRGSGSDQAIFMVDGIILRDERGNQPIIGVPLSAVQEISVQSGGFNPEYNNVRSGIVNVVTKEGDSKKYSGIVSFKIKPPQPKHFGISPYDPNSFWLRPYLDPDVAFTGTKHSINPNTWDDFMQRQYPEWDGWNAFSLSTLQDDNPTNDLTPDAAQQIFRWQHRKQGDIKKPDYYLDAGFGGPVPFVSKSLGNLRFFASMKREKEMYLMEQSRDGLLDQSYMIKLNSDLSPTTKLSIIGLYGEIYATNYDFYGGTDYMENTYDVASTVNTASFTVPWRIYTNLYWSQTSKYYHTISAKVTHVVSPSTFYEFQIKKVGTKYFTGPGRYRDYSKTYEVIPGYYVDESPYGFRDDAVFSIEGSLAFGGAVGVSRDHSKIATYSAKYDLVSQIDKHNQIKTGAEFVYDDFNMQFGEINKFLPDGNIWTSLIQSPYRGSIYFQDKIEFEGWISSVGLISEYVNPNGNWYNLSPFDRGFYSSSFLPSEDAAYKNAKAKGQWTFSPRLSISHPITENSKLYFNYGHLRQIPTSEEQFQIQRDPQNKLYYIGDPTLPLAKTVSYELGYDHALFNDYLFHLSAYYKDVSDQQFWVRYISFDGKVNYFKLTSNSYEDIRGFEADVTKMMGRWITGDINYEYRVGTSGYFGTNQYYENPADQREYLRKNPVQSKPRPQPRFKSNIDLHSPVDFGPTFLGQRLLSDWHFNFIARWTAGSWFTYNPNNVPGIQYNFQWTNTYYLDLKITKIFPLKNLDVKFFADISNLLNFRSFSGLSFYGIHDRDDYFQSLHLPEDLAKPLGYNNIPGNDKPGDYRKDDVEYVPMGWIQDQTSMTAQNANPKVIYYDASTKSYVQSVNEEWTAVAKSKVQKILDDKAYIDMPNQTYFTFLDPRSIFFGITLNYHF